MNEKCFDMNMKPQNFIMNFIDFLWVIEFIKIDVKEW